MSKVNWTKPLEALNRATGQVFALDPMRPNENTFWPFVAYAPERKRDFYINIEHCAINAGASTGDWIIRNRQPTQTATDRLERLEALARRIANHPGHYSFTNEARQLVAEVEPDRDLVMAGEIACAVGKQTGKNAEKFINGENDHSFGVKCAIEALRRARNEGGEA